MEQKFLKNYISRCPITDFSDDGNVEEREHQLDKYLESLTTCIYSRENEFAQGFWEECFGLQQFSIIQQSPLLRRCFIFFDVAVGVFNFITTKYIKNRKSTKSADMLSIQLQYTFKLFKSILTLTMNGCFYSVIGEYRTMYESFVITKYLLLHPELITIYQDHSEFISLYINKMSISFPIDQENRYNELIQLYGEDFKMDFGWTKTIIKNPSKRKLITLANECQVETFFEPLYKVACEFVHPSSLAATTKAQPEFIKPFLQVAMYILNYELVDFINECKVVRKEAVILKNLIDKIFDDINIEFFSNKEVNND